MQRTNQFELDQAPPSLQTMVEEVRAGEEITITEHHKPVAKLVPLGDAARIRPKAGSLRGEVWMASDFNAPMEDFKDYSQ
jgi:prevent-host-death family protein